MFSPFDTSVAEMINIYIIIHIDDISIGKWGEKG